MSTSATWKSLLLVTVSAAATLVAVDIGWRHASPLVWRRQVDDGVRDFRRGDPRILSISSSHGRSMDVVGEVLDERTGEQGRLVSIAMEAGKATHFQFVLDERLRELIEQTRSDGTRVHDRLQRALLVTEWWDSCSWEPGRPVVELASHAWAPRHFIADVLDHGITPTNRNYVRWRYMRLLHESDLVTGRGRGALLPDLYVKLGLKHAGRNAEEEQAFVEWWHHYNEGGEKCIFSAEQMTAYKHIVDYFKSQGLDVTIVLFVRKPGTLTDAARNGTLAKYSAGMREFAARENVRLVDIVLTHPLTDQDFMADFDHVSATGNRKLANWLLDGQLSFLACDVGKPCPVNKDAP
jgi:hypothetical protein